MDLKGYCLMHLNIGKAVSTGDWVHEEAEVVANEDWVDDVARFSRDAGVNAWLAKVKHILQRQSEKAVQEAGWTILFQQFDADGGGTLDCTEFIGALRDGGITIEQCSDTEIRGIFEAVDVSRDGRIDASEFSAWMIELEQKKAQHRRQKKREMSKQTRELIAMVEQFKQASARTISDLGWAKLFKSFDTDESGSLDVEEFIAALRKHGIYQPPLPGEVEVGDRELREVFALIDEDDSGTVSSAEFVSALRSKGTEDYTMTYETFQSSVFELVDYWSAGSTEEDYCSFLKALFHAICCPVDIWREDYFVQTGTAQLGQQSPASPQPHWGTHAPATASNPQEEEDPYPRDSWGISEIGWDSPMHFQDGSIKYKLLRTDQIRSIVVNGKADLSHAARDRQRTEARRAKRMGKAESRTTAAMLAKDQATTQQNHTERHRNALDFMPYRAVRVVQMSPFSPRSPDYSPHGGATGHGGSRGGRGGTGGGRGGAESARARGHSLASPGSGDRSWDWAGAFANSTADSSSGWAAAAAASSSPSSRVGVVHSSADGRLSLSPTPPTPPMTAGPGSGRRSTRSPTLMDAHRPLSVGSPRLSTPRSRSSTRWGSSSSRSRSCRRDSSSSSSRDDHQSSRMRPTILGCGLELNPAPPMQPEMLPAVGVRAGSIASPRRSGGRGDGGGGGVGGGGALEEGSLTRAGIAALANTSLGADDGWNGSFFSASKERASAGDSLGLGADPPAEELVYLRCGRDGHEFIPQFAR